MSNQDERERLARLRERQLRQRDPGPGVKVNWKETTPKKRKPLMEELFGALPRHVKGGLIGLVIGIVLMIVVQFLVANVWQLPAEWMLCGVVALLIPPVLGIIIARGTDLGGFAD